MFKDVLHLGLDILIMRLYPVYILWFASRFSFARISQQWTQNFFTQDNKCNHVAQSITSDLITMRTIWQTYQFFTPQFFQVVCSLPGVITQVPGTKKKL